MLKDIHEQYRRYRTKSTNMYTNNIDKSMESRKV